MTFDGGGICGTYSVAMLLRLITHRPELVASVDLFAGTSTGGIIALALASGLSPNAVLDLYKIRGTEIFKRSAWRRIFSPFGLCESKYTNDGLIAAVKGALGNGLMGNLKRNVVVPAFDLKSVASPDNPSWRMRFFHNLDTDDQAELVSDVAIRTSSAPTFFPSYQGYVDGGVACNDPSLLAVAEAIAHGAALSDIRLMSIGTGGQIKYIDGQDLQWGALAWIRPLLNIFMGGQELVVDALTSKFLGTNYCRLSPVIPDIAMDDVGKVDELLNLASTADISGTLKFLDEIFLA